MDKPAYVYVTYIATTPEKVFNALRDPEMTKLFWGVHKNVSDWNAGSSWEHQDYETGQVHLRGTVLEIDSPRKLVLSWERPVGAPGNEPPSKVTFLIEPFMGATKLTVTHEDLVPGGITEKGISQGWPAVLSSLKSLLESGTPLEMTTRRWTGGR